MEKEFKETKEDKKIKWFTKDRLDIVLGEEYLEKYKVGFPTFEKLFNLKKEELLKILRELCSHDKNCEEVLEDNSNVYKSIENDKPTKIKICSWSTIEITPTGIYYKPEHGTGKDIVLFNKFFTLSSE